MSSTEADYKDLIVLLSNYRDLHTNNLKKINANVDENLADIKLIEKEIQSLNERNEYLSFEEINEMHDNLHNLIYGADLKAEISLITVELAQYDAFVVDKALNSLQQEMLLKNGCAIEFGLTMAAIQAAYTGAVIGCNVNLVCQGLALTAKLLFEASAAVSLSNCNETMMN